MLTIDLLLIEAKQFMFPQIIDGATAGVTPGVTKGGLLSYGTDFRETYRSALGHKWTFCDAEPRPLYPRKRTCAAQTPMSAFGPEADIVPSVDQFVGTGKQ